MQQHTGVPPIIRQHAHPDFMHIIMQSQHAWIMSQHILSPLVQVTQHPFAVISTLHAPIVMLQQHTVMPFMVQHMLHIPPAIMVHRFCIMTHAAGSSHMHVIFIPPAHFSIFIVQRGTITMFGAMTGMPMPIPVAGDEDGIAAVIGFIIAFTMIVSGSVDWYGPYLGFCGDSKLLRCRRNCDNFGRGYVFEGCLSRGSLRSETIKFVVTDSGEMT